MGEWFSVEVSNGPGSARPWIDAYSDLLVGMGLAHGLNEWNLVELAWGFVLELEFEHEASWERFRSETSVVAALDAVPDPVGGLLIHRGRGGTSGARWPRRPRPRAGSGAAALPLPTFTSEDDTFWPAPLVDASPVRRRLPT